MAGTAPLPYTISAPGSPPVERVQANLIGCDLVEPVAVEDGVPAALRDDFRTAFDAPGNTAEQLWLDQHWVEDHPKLRLHLLLTNSTGQSLLVSSCLGGVIIVRAGGARYCDETAWTSLPPGGSVTLYPTIEIPPAFGMHADSLRPRIMHEPDGSWVPVFANAVSFEYSPSGCRPLDAELSTGAPN